MWGVASCVECWAMRTRNIPRGGHILGERKERAKALWWEKKQVMSETLMRRREAEKGRVGDSRGWSCSDQRRYVLPAVQWAVGSGGRVPCLTGLPEDPSSRLVSVIQGRA